MITFGYIFAKKHIVGVSLRVWSTIWKTDSRIENLIQSVACVFFRIIFLNFILDHVIIVVLIWVDTIDVCAKKDLNLKKMNDHANASNQNAT